MIRLACIEVHSLTDIDRVFLMSNQIDSLCFYHSNFQFATGIYLKLLILKYFFPSTKNPNEAHGI